MTPGNLFKPKPLRGTAHSGFRVPLRDLFLLRRFLVAGIQFQRCATAVTGHPHWARQ